MGRSYRRSTGRAIPTLAAALEALDEWKISAEAPDRDDGYVVDYTIQYVFFDPEGVERGVTEEQLKDKGGEGDWPFPGQYAIRVVDSNGEVFIEWLAEHISVDSLARSDDASSMKALVQSMCQTAEAQVRNTQYRLREAEKSEEDAKKKQRIAQEQLAQNQRELAAALIAKETALGERDLAIARQLELQAAYDKLEEDVSVWKPQVQMAVDHAVNRFGEMLFGMKPDNDRSGGSSAKDWDPPPDDLLDAQTVEEQLMAPFFELERLELLIGNGIVTWQMARSLIWHKTKFDPGPTPKWEEWRAERDGAQSAAAE